MRRHPPHHLSPARANHPAGQDPEARLSRPSHHSNAPISPESQSILSKIVALTPSKGSFGNPPDALDRARLLGFDVILSVGIARFGREANSMRLRDGSLKSMPRRTTPAFGGNCLAAAYREYRRLEASGIEYAHFR